MCICYLQVLKVIWILLRKLHVNVLLGRYFLITLKTHFMLCLRKSASCTHISALLHALVAMRPNHQALSTHPKSDSSDTESDLPRGGSTGSKRSLMNDHVGLCLVHGFQLTWLPKCFPSKYSSDSFKLYFLERIAGLPL